MDVPVELGAGWWGRASLLHTPFLSRSSCRTPTSPCYSPGTWPCQCRGYHRATNRTVDTSVLSKSQHIADRVSRARALCRPVALLVLYLSGSFRVSPGPWHPVTLPPCWSADSWCSQRWRRRSCCRSLSPCSAGRSSGGWRPPRPCRPARSRACCPRWPGASMLALVPGQAAVAAV